MNERHSPVHLFPAIFFFFSLCFFHFWCAVAVAAIAPKHAVYFFGFRFYQTRPLGTEWNACLQTMGKRKRTISGVRNKKRRTIRNQTQMEYSVIHSAAKVTWPKTICTIRFAISKSTFHVFRMRFAITKCQNYNTSDAAAERLMWT